MHEFAHEKGNAADPTAAALPARKRKMLWAYLPITHDIIIHDKSVPYYAIFVRPSFALQFCQRNSMDTVYLPPAVSHVNAHLLPRLAIDIVQPDKIAFARLQV